MTNIMLNKLSHVFKLPDDLSVNYMFQAFLVFELNSKDSHKKVYQKFIGQYKTITMLREPVTRFSRLTCLQNIVLKLHSLMCNVKCICNDRFNCVFRIICFITETEQKSALKGGWHFLKRI